MVGFWSTSWLVPVRASRHKSNLAKIGKFEILNSWIIKMIYSTSDQDKYDFFI